MSDPVDFQTQFAGHATAIANRWRARLAQTEAPVGTEAAAPPALEAVVEMVAEAPAGAAAPAPLSSEHIVEVEKLALQAETYAAVLGQFAPDRMAGLFQFAEAHERRLFLTRLSSVCNETVEKTAVRWFLKSDRRRTRLKELTGEQVSSREAPPDLAAVLAITAPLAAGDTFATALRGALLGQTLSPQEARRLGTEAKRMHFAAEQFVTPRKDFNAAPRHLRTELQTDERRAGDTRRGVRRGDRDQDVQALRDFVNDRGGGSQIMLLKGGSCHDRSDLLRRLVRDLAPTAGTSVVVLSLDRPILGSDQGLRRDISIQAPPLTEQLMRPGATVETVPEGMNRLVFVCDQTEHMVQPTEGDAPFVGLLKSLCHVFGKRLRVILAGEPSDALLHAVCPEPRTHDLDATS